MLTNLLIHEIRSLKTTRTQTEASPVIDKIATKALSSALLDGDEVKALSAYTSVDKTTGISLDVELHPSLPLAGLAGNDAGHTPLHLAAAGCMPNILVGCPKFRTLIIIVIFLGSNISLCEGGGGVES